jgi:hypothetical protein
MESTMTINDFIYIVTRAENHRKADERLGPALFRSLCKNYESVAINIQGTPVDPYHDEDNIKDFLVYLLEHEVKD